MDLEADFPVSGYLRQARRRARLNQRELAQRAGVEPSTLARLEAGTSVPSVVTLLRLLQATDLHLAVVDEAGRWVPPLQEPPQTRDHAARRFPAHLPLVLDPDAGEWWGDRFGLVRPPETFHRDPAARREHRARAHRWRGVGGHPVPKIDWRQGRTSCPGTQDTGHPGWQLLRPPWQRGETGPATPSEND